MKQTRRFAKLLIVLVLAMVLSAVLVPFTAAATAAQPQSTATIGLAGDRLDQNSKQLYLFLKEKITAIANGTSASAKIELSQDTLNAWGIRTVWTNKDFNVETLENTHMQETGTLFWKQFDLNAIVEALLHDCPFELYWFDKTDGVLRACNTSITGKGTVYDTATVRAVMFAFTVARDYRTVSYDANNPTVDTAKTAEAFAVRAKAALIVAKYANHSDYEKLIGYRDEICRLVSYNDAAVAPSYNRGYGDPWQVIYVFDGKADTNVVCEGYAKAFKLLCDMTDFERDVTCYTVAGVMTGGRGAGNHMWNVVSMSNGAHYIVDVTNSDEGTIGEDGELFLTGYSASTSAGYRVDIGSQSISFAYNNETFQLWGNGEDSILRIANSDYEPSAILVSVPSEIRYSGQAVAVGKTGTTISCSCADGEDTTELYKWEYTWYNEQGVEIGSAINAGTYSLKVTATNLQDPSDVRSKTVEIVIQKGIPTFQKPMGLTATYGQKLSSVALPTGFAWEDATAYVGNAGKNAFVVVYTPTDTENYETVRLAVEVAVGKATPSYTVPTDIVAGYGDKLEDVKLPTGFSWQTDGDTLVGDVGKKTFKAIFTPADTHNYSVVENIDINVTVGTRDIGDVTVVLGKSPSYDGKKQTQTIESVTVNGVVVTYTVSGNTATDIGVYTLTITGTGNFTGTKTVEWRLTPNLSAVESLNDTNVKSSDRAAIEAIKTQLAGQESDWAELLSSCDALLARIDAVAKEADTVVAEAKKWNASAVTITDIGAITELLARVDALASGQNLTEAEKAPVLEAKQNLEACRREIEAAILKIVVIAVGVFLAIVLLCVIISVLVKRKKKKKQKKQA